MKAQLTFELEPTVAAAVHAALLPEVAEGPTGSTTVLTRSDGQIVADIEADTLSTLRAAINNVVRLLDAAERVAA